VGGGGRVNLFVTAVAAFTKTTSETLTMQTGQTCWNCKTLFAYGSGKGCCNRRFCRTCALRACRMQSRTALHTCRHVQCKQRLPVTSRVRASRRCEWQHVRRMQERSLAWFQERHPMGGASQPRPLSMATAVATAVKTSSATIAARRLYDCGSWERRRRRLACQCCMD